MASYRLATTSTRPCVWMSAGLIRYRLCDRDYECESCPLDAALHPEPPPELRHRAYVSAAEAAGAVPGDRRYSAGHTWVQRLGEDPTICRLGIDAFAAAIIGVARGVRAGSADRSLARGDLVCDLDVGLGLLALGAPVGGLLVRTNPALEESPGEVIQDPYGAGWLAQIAGVDPTELRRLCGGDVAREQTRADLTRFRRTVALRLFQSLGVGEVGWLGMGQRLTDLREMLGPEGYLELVARFVH